MNPSYMPGEPIMVYPDTACVYDWIVAQQNDGLSQHTDSPNRLFVRWIEEGWEVMAVHPLSSFGSYLGVLRKQRTEITPIE